MVVGGGLAGSEAAWQAAERGIAVIIYEMRPLTATGAHFTSDLAELVCSNSLGSNLIDRASGLLKEELRILDSRLLKCAEETSLPAGSALAVDRTAFSQAVTLKISSHPNIRIIREEITEIPAGTTIIASGPLTSEGLVRSIQKLTGQNHLYFFDAIAPIVTRESINMDIAFKASRYRSTDGEDGDYINCPMTREEYSRFVNALIGAERVPLRDFEADIEQGVDAGMYKYFEGCLPVEILARRGTAALAYGPLRPVGLRDPRTGKSPHAVVQLRQDNLAGSLYNLVGFQTNLTYSAQKRVFRMIPGLENAEFVRYGQMHRNTFIASPLLLLPTLQFRKRADLFFAGQITGVEGYMGNIATGLLAGINAAHYLQGKPLLELPQTTMLGALCNYITHADMKDYQPMKANFGILPESPKRGSGKRQRNAMHASRSLDSLTAYLAQGTSKGIE